MKLDPGQPHETWSRRAWSMKLLGFYVKATGKGGTQKRQELVNLRPGERRRSLEHWQLRAEEKQRLLEKKEEAWELFRRQPGHKQTTKEKFAHEFKRRVTNMMDGPASSKVQEKYLLEWMNELEKGAQEEERRLEVLEIKRMSGEDAQSRNRQAWDKISWPSSNPLLALRGQSVLPTAQ